MRKNFTRFDENPQEIVDLLKCSACGRQASRDDLSAFGARCRACYGDYCRHVPGKSALSVDEKREIASKLRALLQSAGRIGGTPAAVCVQRLAEIEAEKGKLSAPQLAMRRSCERLLGIEVEQ